MDEYIGRRRLRMRGVVIEARAGAGLVWQLARGIKLPIRLHLELRDDDGRVQVTHTVLAGFRGPGRILDPAFGLVLSRRLRADHDQYGHIHVGVGVVRSVAVGQDGCAASADARSVVCSRFPPRYEEVRMAWA